MSMNATRGDFVRDYVVARSQPRTLPGRIAMGAMIVVLLLALAATFLGRGALGDLQVEAGDVLMQGP